MSELTYVSVTMIAKDGRESELEQVLAQRRGRSL